MSPLPFFFVGLAFPHGVFEASQFLRLWRLIEAKLWGSCHGKLLGVWVFKLFAPFVLPDFLSIIHNNSQHLIFAPPPPATCCQPWGILGCAASPLPRRPPGQAPCRHVHHGGLDHRRRVRHPSRRAAGQRLGHRPGELLVQLGVPRWHERGITGGIAQGMWVIHFYSSATNPPPQKVGLPSAPYLPT